MELHAAVPSGTQIDIDTIAAAATRQAGFEITSGDVALALVNFPMDEARVRHAAGVEWAIWDKETSINGVAADVVTARSDYNGGEIYLIWIDGTLTFLQPHRPDAAAPIHADEAHEVAAIHATQIVDELYLASS